MWLNKEFQKNKNQIIKNGIEHGIIIRTINFDFKTKEIFPCIFEKLTLSSSLILPKKIFLRTQLGLNN